MAIITERFLATHKPAEKTGEFTWHFYARGRSGDLPHYEIEFTPRFREFRGWRVEHRHSHNTFRGLSEKDLAKLRAMLPPDDLAECTKAALGIGR
ncbi:MAG: hypothetical protein EOS72_03355 [Mesorhizobium sp.]|uniref:hypothetical protein n=1 Tax=Mesorhizobium sp. TaxID=1871066 RepID=UPI000FE682F1|nr:hypothetical protein [Mesorhizobium sp.]RWC91706.1 MAG: hypothetical protein EOS72_03355 [Mesorhizobium sp.]